MTTAAAVVAGLAAPKLLAAPFRAVERLGSRATRRAPVLVCAVAAFLVYAAAGAVRMPVPVIHDEYSNLLLADTLRQGRLANPSPPLARHFENFHILTEPSYASKFPPGIGAVLAAGRWVGHPIAGMWLAVAGTAAALCWGLGAFVPRSWAVLAAVLVVTHPLAFDWGEAYWGGGVPLLGASLAAGGVARLASTHSTGRARWLAAVVAAAGCAVLMSTRPYEGGALTAALAVTLPLFHRRRLLAIVGPLAAACAAILGPAAVFLLFYNWRVTGHPLVLPYVVYEQRYNPTPLFVWDRVEPRPIVAPPDMKQYYTGLILRAERQRTAAGWLRETRRKFEALGDDLFRLSPSWIRWVPALMLAPLPLVLLRRREVRAAATTLLLTLAAILCVTWYAAYYLAVLFPLLALLWITSLRRLRAVRLAGRRTGLLWSRLAVLAWISAFAVGFAERKDVPWMWQAALDRARIESELHRRPGQDLVLVEYGPHHFVHTSWTYNGADLAGAPVIWARSLTPAENRELMALYPGRRVWLVEPERNARVTPLR